MKLVTWNRAQPRTARSSSPPRSHPVARWALNLFALTLILVGALLTTGGLWLVILGGSWYYLLAGAALVISGWLVIRRRLGGLILYWITCAATVAWALWEVGPEPWALMPRVLAPAVVALIGLALLPLLTRKEAP